MRFLIVTYVEDIPEKISDWRSCGFHCAEFVMGAAV